MTFHTRFAPSPTGPLHLGHAYAAWVAHDLARASGGTFQLRIEDIDRSRARPQWDAQLRDDLRFLGLSWPEPVMRQSNRMPAYRAALAALWSRGLLYRCDCNRHDIAAALQAPQEGAPVLGPDGPVYPGTCRARHPRTGPMPDGALRLDTARALDLLGIDALSFTETGPDAPQGPGSPVMTAAEFRKGIGDVVLARRGMGTSYHLAVTVDDAAQGITLVTRGADLFEATFIHVLLQHLLGLPLPGYHHHRLIRDAQGKRLAKRDDSRAIALYRAEGASAQDIRRMVWLPLSTSAP